MVSSGNILKFCLKLFLALSLLDLDFLEQALELKNLLIPGSELLLVILLLLDNELRHLSSLPAAVAHDDGIDLFTFLLANCNLLLQSGRLHLGQFQLGKGLLLQQLAVAELDLHLLDVLLEFQLFEFQAIILFL